MNSSLAAVFQMLELGKQAKHDNSQEGGAEIGKEVMQLREFCTVRRRAELKKNKKKQDFSKFHSACYKGAHTESQGKPGLPQASMAMCYLLPALVLEHITFEQQN